MRNAGRLIGAASIALLLLAGCSSSSSSDKADGGGGATTTAAPEPIRILVTNDDGYNADGIDAVVEGLKTLPNVEITVVAPATNQSGTGGNTTTGALTVTDVTTKSGYKAKAVAGFPADTIIWAIDQKGIDFVPDLVISGINAGQNMGPVVDVSGTVGAARAAVSRGIPALAASQGLGDPTNFAAGQKQVLAWLEANMAAIEGGTLSTATVPNLNIPTCPTGDVRGQIEVPVATSADGYNDTPDCLSTSTNPTDDIQAFLIGYAPVSQLSVKPAAG
jgi:5'-nucleotidase